MNLEKKPIRILIKINNKYILDILKIKKNIEKLGFETDIFIQRFCMIIGYISNEKIIKKIEKIDGVSSCIKEPSNSEIPNSIINRIKNEK